MPTPNLLDPNSLREHHRRLTRPRRVVLEVLAAAEKHLTPQQVFQRARAQNLAIGLTTIYRTLDLLVDLGYVQRIHLDSGCHSYAPSATAHGHQLVCSGCGRAEEFAECDLAPLVNSLQQKTGFAIETHMLELMGRCPECQSKMRKRALTSR